MFNRIRRRVRRISGSDSQPAAPRATTVALRVPNPYGGAPWLTATVALSHSPQAHGDALRLRAHLDGALCVPRSGLAGSARLARDADNRGGLARYGRSVAASLVRSAIERLPSHRLAPLTSRRWRSWLDVQLSTAPLDGGAAVLMPERLRGIYGGALPSAGAGQPRIGVWAGPAGGPAGGIARLALLQIDERDRVAPRGADAEAGPGFNLNASIAQLIEPVSPYRRRAAED